MRHKFGVINAPAYPPFNPVSATNDQLIQAREMIMGLFEQEWSRNGRLLSREESKGLTANKRAIESEMSRRQMFPIRG